MINEKKYLNLFVQENDSKLSYCYLVRNEGLQAMGRNTMLFYRTNILLSTLEFISNFVDSD